MAHNREKYFNNKMSLKHKTEYNNIIIVQNIFRGTLLNAETNNKNDKNNGNCCSNMKQMMMVNVSIL